LCRPLAGPRQVTSDAVMALPDLFTVEPVK
jgi:hypothetical protein